MKKKNLLTIVVSLALVVILAVGATLAYFTSKDAVNNTFTLGQISIDLQEKKSADAAWADGPLSFENMMPLDTADKMAQVVVKQGSADCYVRVTMDIIEAGAALTDADISDLYKSVEAAVTAKDAGSIWAVTETKTGDNITGLSYVCKNIVSAKDAAQTLSLFDAITLPNLGNNAQNQGFKLSLNAYAVQSANLLAAGQTYADINWSALTFD